MPPITVDRGLNTNDPVTLEPGELARADNAYYKPGDFTIYKGLGRDGFNSISDTDPLKAVRALGFDGTPGLFVVASDTRYRKATIGDTGSFSDMVTGLTGSASLDSAHYNNEHFLFNGVDRNRVVRSDGTAILHGMLTQTAPPVVTDTGAGAGFILSANNTMTYWIEERYKEGSTIIKRSASTPTETTTLTGTGATIKPVVFRPAQVNPDTTHWAAYATATNGAFPVGAEIGEVALATPSMEDLRTGTDPTLPSGANYEIVAFTDIFGVTQSIARNGPTAIASSGDIMDDCLVTNDVSDRSRLRYSLPNTPHKMPANQLIRFETKEEDEVVAFRYVGNVGIALLRDSAWSVLTLPRPDDSSFQIERVKKQIDGAFGCVGPKAQDIFSFGEGALLAYVSPEGVVWTDGSSWSVVTDDLDFFPDLIEPTLLSRVVLTNNRTYYRLEMRYAPVGATRNTKVFLLHYHPSHLKTTPDGRVRCKVTGPHDLSANDACVAFHKSRHIVFTANENGKLYQEDSGFAFDSGEVPVMLVRTRDEYLGGIGGESTIRTVLIHHPAAPGESATIRMVQLVHGYVPESASTIIPLTYREATPGWQQAKADAFQFEFESSSTSAEVGVTLFVAVNEPSKLEGA